MLALLRHTPNGTAVLINPEGTLASRRGNAAALCLELIWVSLTEGSFQVPSQDEVSPADNRQE